MIFSVITPLLSLIVLTLGSGLLTTLLTIRLHMQGSDSWVIGGITTIYYLGLVLGSYYTGPLIHRVGHIRVYAIFASLFAVAAMLQGIMVNVWLWFLLRFISGYCIAGLYIAVQSWLLIIVPQEMRGRVLSLYMISFYAALGAGQFLLNIGNLDTLLPFCVVAILCSLSLVPLAMTKAASPNIEEVASLNLRRIYAISPSGVVGCIAGGLLTSAIYGLMPLFVKQLDLPDSFVAATMGSIIFGAMFLQYPIGRISDFIDRRTILLITSFVSLVISFMLLLSAHWLHSVFLVLAFVFGGSVFIIYPLSVSHACDYLKGKEIIAATQGLLLANSIGSIVGPLIVPAFILAIGPSGLFIYFMVITGLLGIFFKWHRSKRTAIPAKEQHQFISIPTTPVTKELNSHREGK